MGYEAIRYEIRDAVATIALNRPEAYNALNLTLGRDLFHATLEADEDRAVRCIVITGTGKAFCAGGDVKDFNDSPDRIGILIKELTTYLHGAVSRLARTAKPVIMAVNGVAAGGGMSLALAGDLVVAAESAKFTMAYSKIAASPDGSSSYFLPRMIGLRRALELHYTNRVLSAREAMDWGLVNRVHPDAEFGSAVAPGDPDGARGPGHRRERTHGGLQERRRGIRQEAAGGFPRPVGARSSGSSSRRSWSSPRERRRSRGRSPTAPPAPTAWPRARAPSPAFS